jgi:hypothetical protein
MITRSTIRWHSQPGCRLASLLAALLLAIFAAPPSTRADCVDKHLVSLFPKPVAEFSCADLKAARNLSWFNDFKGQVLPAELYGFDQYLVSVGVNPNTDVKRIVWAIGSPRALAASASATTKVNPSAPAPEVVPDADQFLGFLVGEFDADNIESALKQSRTNLAVVHDRGHSLYQISIAGRAAALYFTALDTDYLAVGTLPMLRAMIDVDQGAAESLLANQPMLDLISAADGDATFWGVFNGAGARSAVRALAPSSAGFLQSSKMYEDLRSLVITAGAGTTDVEVKFAITTDSSEDSAMLAQILQAALMYRKYSAQSETPANPALATALDKVSVTPQSATVNVSIDLANDQLRDLILQRTFAGM